MDFALFVSACCGKLIALLIMGVMLYIFYKVALDTLRKHYRLVKRSVNNDKRGNFIRKADIRSGDKNNIRRERGMQILDCA